MTLSQLVKSIMIRERLSYRDLEARALASGHVMGAAHFHKVVTHTVKRLPDDRTLRAVAAALGVDLAEVRYAALRSLGWSTVLPCLGGGGCMVIIAAESLTAQEIEKVRASAERTKRKILRTRARQHSSVAS